MARKKKKSIITIVWDNGSRFEVTDVTPKYYVCDNVQFRKSNVHIKDVIISEQNDTDSVK